MPELSEREFQELVLLYRNIVWRYQLDSYEDEALKIILAAVTLAERNILARLREQGASLTDWNEQRSLALLDELSDLTLGLRATLVRSITTVATRVGVASYLTHNAITSFDGRVVPFNSVALSATQMRSLVEDTPVGGHLLSEWVDRTFDQAVVSGIREEILAGRMLGEGYEELVSRITDGFNIVRRDAITLTRTYVQSANVGAMEAVYEANREVVKGVRWSAVMEIGTRPGRGTCLRCAALDGQEFKWGEPRPPCPMHARCRCVLVPWMRTWRELGLDVEEMEEVYQPWTRRTDVNIDAGRRGHTIIESGFHQGNFASWFNRLSQDDQLNIVGPGRLSLIRSGRVTFSDLVDRTTGRLRLLERDSRRRIVGLLGLERRKLGF